MLVWMIGLGIIGVGVVLVISARIYEQRVDEKVADTANWIMTEATIQDAVMERLDRYRWFPSFGFSYSVKGEYFSGRFFLKADEEQSNNLIKTLLNQKVSLQYDPDEPSAWYIAESTVAGCEIIQELSPDYPRDSGPYRSDGDEPIDLNLHQ